MIEITFDCPHCGQNLVVDVEGVGLDVPCPACTQPVTIPDTPEAKQFRWQQVRAILPNRDDHRCVACGVACSRGEADVHHLMPRNLGGSDEIGNLVTLCDGCHATHHPNLQLPLARRFVERWALRIAKWLDTQGELPDGTPNLGGALRLLGLQKDPVLVHQQRFESRRDLASFLESARPFYGWLLWLSANWWMWSAATRLPALTVKRRNQQDRAAISVHRLISGLHHNGLEKMSGNRTHWRAESGIGKSPSFYFHPVWYRVSKRFPNFIFLNPQFHE